MRDRTIHKWLWRHSDVKPNDLMYPYKLPFLSKEELDFLKEKGDCSLVQIFYLFGYEQWYAEGMLQS